MPPIFKPFVTVPAPVIIFTYNRPGHLQNTLASLNRCVGAAGAEVIVCCDGPRNDHDRVLQQQIAGIIKQAQAEAIFASLQFRQSENNKGLYQSISAGVTETVEKYGSVIVLEDDLEVSPWFLDYMNRALELYEKAGNVYSVNAYMFDIPTRLQKTVLLPYTSSWGWATWKQKWAIFNSPIAEAAFSNPGKHLKRRFNLAEYDYMRIWKTKRTKSWAIQWYYQVFIRNGLGVFPTQSLIVNKGFDGSGENCGNNFLRSADIPATGSIEVVLEDRMDLAFFDQYERHFSTLKHKSVRLLKNIFS